MNQVMEPCALGKLQLRNRIVRSATADPQGLISGEVSVDQVEKYRVLAKNHVGLIITGMSYIHPSGAVSAKQNSIASDEMIPSHKVLTEAVHQAGGTVVLQINHAGAASMQKNAVSPSGIPSPYTNLPAREMTIEEIKETVQQFAEGAKRTKMAGYDGVQIHLAHGYLLSQFIDPTFNHRQDAYGGSVENRFRFAEEVIVAVKAAVGEDYPVLVKINSNTMTDDDAYEDALLWMGKRCETLGIAAIEISGVDFTPQGRKGNHNYYLSRAIKVRQAAGIPVMLVGGVRTVEDMQAVLEAGVDFISLSRPFICEPDLVAKLMEGQEKSACLSCSKCFVLSFKYTPGAPLCILHQKGEGK